MKKILITAFIISNSIIGYCQHSFMQDLGSEGKITFPDTPKVDFSKSIVSYIYQNKSYEIYAAQVMDLTSVDPDSLKASLYDQCSQFADNFVHSLHGRILHSEKIKADGFAGIDINYKCKIKGSIYFGYQHVIRSTGAIVSYSLMSPDSLSPNDNKIGSFFQTFKLTPKKAAEAKKQSGIMAGAIMLSALLFWVIIVFYLIGRSKKKKRQEMERRRSSGIL